MPCTEERRGRGGGGGKGTGEGRGERKRSRKKKRQKRKFRTGEHRDYSCRTQRARMWRCAYVLYDPVGVCASLGKGEKKKV